MAKTLTDMQKLFLEYLFGEADQNATLAKQMAGYSSNYPTSAVVESLKDEIIEHTKLYLTRNGPKAARKVVDVLDDPTKLGTKEVLAAAKEILDRIGVVKTEKIEVGGSAIFVLPAKKEEDDE